MSDQTGPPSLSIVDLGVRASVCYGGVMTCEEAVKTIPCGRYRHFKGNEYEVIGIARHSEDESPVVVYRALYGDGGLWVRPAEMWNETVTWDGTTHKRFMRIET